MSYVALTRARTHLAIVLPAGKLRPESLAASIVAVGAALDQIAGVQRVSPRASLLDEPPLTATASDAPPAPPPDRPARPRVTLATIGVTALSDFAICARRFELSHLFNIAEPRLTPAKSRTGCPAAKTRARSAAPRIGCSKPSRPRVGASAIEPEEILQALAREGLRCRPPSRAWAPRAASRAS